MDREHSEKEWAEKNKKLKRELQSCQEQLRAYREGFLSQERIILGESARDASKFLKGKQYSSQHLKKWAYADWKAWFSSIEWGGIYETSLDVLDQLFSEDEDLSIQAAKEIQVKITEKLGDQGPLEQQREALEKTLLFLSLICAVWENNF